MAIIDIETFNVLDELVQYGYDVQRHADRARELINLIYKLRHENFLRTEFSFTNRNHQLEMLETHYRASIEMLDVTLQLFLGERSLKEFNLQPSAFGEGVFLAHASDAFHETTTTFYPIMHDLAALYIDTPELADATFGTASAEAVGYYFLQNVPPAFVSSTVLRDSATSQQASYTRTFIMPIDFNHLLLDDKRSQLIGWICSVTYLIASMTHITENGYKHIGGGGVVPAISSHGIFSRVARLADSQTLAKFASIFGTVPFVDSLTNLVGVDAEQLTLLRYLSRKQAYPLLKSLLDAARNMDYHFTSGHTGTALLILKTLEKTIAHLHGDRAIKVGFLGAGGSILKSTILTMLDSQVLDMPQPIQPVFYDIDPIKVQKLSYEVDQRGQSYTIASDFGDLMRQCDIVISAITVVTDEMKAFFDAEFAGAHHHLASTIIIEDTYPSQLPVAKINEAGGSIVLVLGQEGNERYEVVRHAISYRPSATEPQDFTYGLLSDTNEVADYGCGAELLTLAVARHRGEDVMELSGPANADKVQALNTLWHQHDLVSLAPLQDGLGLVTLGTEASFGERIKL